jgi:hypothetical protein
LVGGGTVQYVEKGSGLGGISDLVRRGIYCATHSWRKPKHVHDLVGFGGSAAVGVLLIRIPLLLGVVTFWIRSLVGGGGKVDGEDGSVQGAQFADI